MWIDEKCHGRDVVLDTNVLIHSTNSTSEWQASSIEVLSWLRECEGTKWVLDDQGKAAPDPRTSVLFREYTQHLGAQSLPLIMLANFLKSGRVGWARRPDQLTRKHLRELIPRNVPDQAVAGAAHGSTSKMLVSNDLADFNLKTREALRKRLGVTIVTSGEAARTAPQRSEERTAEAAPAEPAP